MKTTIVKKEVRCEVCGGSIAAGETVGVRYCHNWDNPDEDMQGSVSVSFYRHVNKADCEKEIEVLRLRAQMDAQNEENVYHKATE
jgi:hypothetical protein